MIEKRIVVAGLLLAAGVPLVLVGGVGHAAPPVQAQPAGRPTAIPANPVRIKRPTKLEAQNAAAVPGETRNVKATLKGAADNGPIAGKNVTFKLSGKQPNGQNVVFVLGADATNAQGEASVAWKVPELGQGPYALTATFAGDDDTAAASAQANFGIIKGITKLELSDVSYGALDSHGGPKYHTVIVRLLRQADDATLNKTVKITMNGNERTVSLNPLAQLLLQPDNASQWTLKVDFAGDDANQATSAQRTYHRVPGS